MVERAAVLRTDLIDLESVMSSGPINPYIQRAYDRLTAELVRLNIALDEIARYSREDYPR